MSEQDFVSEDLVHPTKCGCMTCSFINRDSSDSQGSLAGSHSFSSSHSFSVPVSNQIESLLLGFSWTGTVGQATTITYTTSVADDVSLPSAGFGVTNFTEFNAVQKNILTNMLNDVENLVNIDFVQVSNVNDADIVFRQGDLTPGVAGWVVPSSVGTQYLQADLVISSLFGANPMPNTFDYLLILHELGHALGLGHPHDGVIIDDPSLDTNDFTVMSYNVGPSSGFFSNVPISMMTLDIQALQYLYGANTDYNAGNTVIDLSSPGGVVQTIWDGGGVDTVTTQSYLGGVSINLREDTDAVSTIGSSSAWMAFGANIENAITGALADVIQGNTLNNHLQSSGGNDSVYGDAGDDSIEGQGGDDLTQGNMGNDTVYGGTGNDMVLGGQDNDFINGNAGNDIVNGNRGNDTVQGGRDNDTVQGGQDNDFVNGNLGNDIVYGNRGDDIVRGGRDQDSVLGGDGNDTIYGDRGNDLLWGEEGADVFVFDTNSGADTINDFSSEDVLYISSGLASSVQDVVNQSSIQVGGLFISFGSGDSITLSGVSSLGLDNILIY